MRPASGLFGMLAVASAVIAGCTMPQAPGVGALDMAALEALDTWELRGRVALNAGGQGVQANVLWRQDGRTARLELSGPWGIGAERVLIEGAEVLFWSDGDWVSLCASGAGATVAELELLCRSAPLSSLPFWLRGLPDPLDPYTETYPPQGGAREFRQAGWQVQVGALTRSHDLNVPRRVFISGPGATLKVAITRWDLRPAS